MFAKRFFCVSAMTLCFALGGSSHPRRATAQDATARWGIGAGLFQNGGEASLIRRSGTAHAILLDLAVVHGEAIREYNSPPPSPTQREVQSTTLVEVGPGWRSIVGGNKNWKPYLDVFAHATYQRLALSAGNAIYEDSRGFRTGVAFGLERELPWDFSIACHAEFVTYSWASLRGHLTDASGVETPSSGEVQEIRVGLSPSLFVRVYF